MHDDMFKRFTSSTPITETCWMLRYERLWFIKSSVTYSKSGYLCLYWIHMSSFIFHFPLMLPSLHYYFVYYCFNFISIIWYCHFYTRFHHSLFRQSVCCFITFHSHMSWNPYEYYSHPFSLLTSITLAKFQLLNPVWWLNILLQYSREHN